MGKKTGIYMSGVFVCLWLGITAVAQVKQPPGKASVQLLQQVLKQVTEQSGVQFIYTHEAIEGKSVLFNRDDVNTMPVEQLLKKVLTGTTLSFKKVGNKYYSIIPEVAPGNTSVRAATDTSLLHITSLPSGSNGAVITGILTERKTGLPVPLANVSLAPLGLFTLTDEKGAYTFTNIPAIAVTLLAENVNMQSTTRDIIITTPALYTVSFRLEESVLSLKEVQVVATESKGATGTSSLIGQAAIAHLQASSLADIMQLLPGVTASNPDLSQINKFAIRQIDADNMGSMGTAVLLNGIPLSNNANLQATNTAKSGVLASFAAMAGAGTDFRQVPADNIESVEVIRGVPSVEYGDLTSGVVLVKTKAGKMPLEAKARINPRLTQFWVGKGIVLNKQAGTLNVDVDYSRAYKDQRYEAGGYTRLTTNLLYSRRLFKNLSTTTGFTYAINLDETKQDPDDIKTKTALKAREQSFRFNTTGKWNLHSPLARLLSYTLSANYTVQKGYQQSQVGGAVVPLLTAMKDTTMVAQYSPLEYLSQIWIEGKPLNLFAKITNTLYGKTGLLKHRILMGAEWKMDANYGSGKTFDLNKPPSPNSDGNANRPRKYSDIPALQQWSSYAEDNMAVPLAGRDLFIQAGVRLDKVSVVGSAISPRINLSYQVTPALALRAGYGIAAKVPSLLYLYPQKAYFDFINRNYYKDNAAERLLIGTTKVYETTNSQLRMAVNHKKEIGFDLKINDAQRLTVSVYHERTRNGYAFDYTLQSVGIVSIDTFRIVSTPANQPPVVAPAGTINRIANYQVPTNNTVNINKGIEFDYNMGRIAPLRTSFVLNGAWMSSTSYSSGYYIVKWAAQNASEQDPEKVAVYAPGRGTQDQQFSTTLRAIHHIPELRFIATLSVQTIWVSSNKYLHYDSIPVGYISRSNGAVTWFSEAERTKITRSDKELFMNQSAEYYVTESWKPLCLFNLRLTKEIGNHIQFSFYANNVLMHNPLQESNRWKGVYTRRNPGLFFGTELNIKF